jgi:GntR family transcriptional regulator
MKNAMTRSPHKSDQMPADDPTPLYHRIYMVLKEKIRDHAFPIDRPMPGEVELARQFGVSRITIRKTFERLEREGLILRQRGRGTFATPPAGKLPVQVDVRGLVENLLAMGLHTTVRVLEFGYEPAPPAIAAEMGIEPGAIVQKAVRLRSIDQRPFSYALTHVPEDVGRTYTESDLVEGPLLRLLERAGIEIAGGYQRVSARAADSVVAPLLDVEVGAPLVSVLRLVRDRSGRTVERINALYRPEHYAFEIELTLHEGPQGTLWRPAAAAI